MTPTLPAKPATAESIYDEVIKSLPASERLKVATLILNGIPPQAVVDEDSQEDEDLKLITQASMRYAVQSFEEEEDDTDNAETR